MRKLFEIGGLVTAFVLVVFGIGAIVMGADARSTVQSNLAAEQIVGSPDMTPDAITAEASKAGLPTSVTLPTCSVADQAIDTGDRARCFAEYMRIHALVATGGLTYAQMPRFATDDGKGTNDAAAATKDDQGQPVANAARNIWVSETALATALNSAYSGEKIALFGIVVGVALLLTGIGFGILAIGGALRNRERPFGAHDTSPATASPAAV